MTGCAHCGTLAEVDTAADTPFGWSWTPTERGIEWMCPPCTRDNVRSIEAKLPEEWW